MRRSPVTRQLVGLAMFAAAAVVLLGGCGGSSKKPLTKTAYLTSLKSIAAELGTAISATTTATTPAGAATALTTAQAALRAAVKQLNELTPPANAQAAQAKLVTAASEFADELDPVIAKLKAGNLEALGEVTSLKGFVGIEAAGAALAKAGYDINPA